VWATDVVTTKRREMARRFGIGWAKDNRELVVGSEIVVLAVKPQTLPQVLAEIREAVSPRTLFVSIAAGFPLRRLAGALGEKARLVRVMPNTPALVGKGMSVAVRGGGATVSDERRVLRLLRAVGDAITVADERLLDPVTGLSGSGPAYVYLFAEALIAGGVQAGLDPAASRRLVLQTLDGACAMLKETPWSPRELREMVSSPGGTTLAGLGVLEQAGFFQAVVAAVERATARSRELGA
ncbi:MAG: pyrroline-5-carboxylate reductase, partial [Candidatus Binatia bacterium]